MRLDCKMETPPKFLIYAATSKGRIIIKREHIIISVYPNKVGAVRLPKAQVSSTTNDIISNIQFGFQRLKCHQQLMIY